MKKNILKGLGVLVLFIALSLNTASATLRTLKNGQTSTTINVSPSGFTIRVTLDIDIWEDTLPYYDYFHNTITGYFDIFMKNRIPGNSSSAYEVGRDSHILVKYPNYPKLY